LKYILLIITILHYREYFLIITFLCIHFPCKEFITSNTLQVRFVTVIS